MADPKKKKHTFEVQTVPVMTLSSHSRPTAEELGEETTRRTPRLEDMTQEEQQALIDKLVNRLKKI